MRWWSGVVVLLGVSPALCQAAPSESTSPTHEVPEPPADSKRTDPARLDPNDIAHDYTRTDAIEHDYWRGPAYAPIRYIPTSLAKVRLVPEAGNKASWKLPPATPVEDESQPPGLAVGLGDTWGQLRTLVTGPNIVAALQFDASAGAFASVEKLSDALAVGVGTWDSTSEDRTERWEGLTESEDDTRGRTLSLGGGQVLGDLTIGLGAVGSSASLGEVLEGSAGVEELNPFKDVSAQFDLVIYSAVDWRAHPDVGVVVLRLRATYLNALKAGGDGDSAGAGVATELGVSVGLKW